MHLPLSVTARAAWPLRRIVAVAVLSPGLLARSIGGVRGTTPAPAEWTGLATLVAVTSVATLATYLPQPETGRQVDLGCTPCASIAALSVLISAVVLGSASRDVPTTVRMFSSHSSGTAMIRWHRSCSMWRPSAATWSSRTSLSTP